jgi:hypothetical protein
MQFSRYFFSALLLFFAIIQAKSQCLITLGPDETICTDFGQAEFTLGQNLFVMDGIPPYSYSWSCEVETFFFDYTASDFLNDTTLAEPELIDFGIDSLTFVLTVTDSEGNTCSDSINVFICSFGIDLADGQFTIDQGDTVSIYSSVGGNCMPVTYQWEPNYNISDVNASNPQVWPDTTTFYTNVATDSAGCSMFDGDIFEVYVNPLSTSSRQGPIEPKLYPNPMVDFTTVDLSGMEVNGWSLEIYDVMGRRVRSENLVTDQQVILKGQLTSGVYSYRILDGNEVLGKGQFVVR